MDQPSFDSLWQKEAQQYEMLFRLAKEALGRLMEDVKDAAGALDNLAFIGAREKDLLKLRTKLDDAHERARQAWIKWSIEKEIK